MGIFNFFKRKEPAQLSELRTSKLPISERIKQLQKQQREYEAAVAIVYKDKGIAQFKTSVKASNRAHAANKINGGLSLKVLSVKQLKK
jgi:hypothetical protein